MVHCDFKPVPEGIEFRPVRGHETLYAVSRCGLVLSRARAFRHGHEHKGVSSFLDHVMTPIIRDGFAFVALPLPGPVPPGSPPWKRQRKHAVRRLVYEAWRGEAIPPGHVLIEIPNGRDLAGRLIPISRGLNAGLNNSKPGARENATRKLEKLIAEFEFA